ncbi:MAG: yciF [Hyphomicrobiales bacterium]|nr:yciF [Hyphomicrobiales bacterium]
MAAVKTMQDLFVHTLKDIYYAEKLIYRSLPKMIKQASSPELKQAFEKHREETEGQIERLEQVFEECEIAARGVRCEAMDGIIAEAKDVMDEVEDDQVRDAGMLAAAQTIEHYEMSRYGTLIAWAKQLGMKNSIKLLQQTLDEEKKTDKLLSELAINTVNQNA